MNRYQIQSDQYEVWCGWDEPTQSLFGQVCNKRHEDDDDHIVRWVGGSHDEIRSVEELQKLLAPFIIIPDNIVSLLQLDIIKAMPKTELQEQVRKVARGNS